MKTRPATRKDFKIGTRLTYRHDASVTLTLTECWGVKGIWGCEGGDLAFENEAECFLVECI